MLLNRAYIKILLFFLGIFFVTIPLNLAKSETKELDDDKYTLFTGKFDFSDHGKKSNLIGLEHQSDDLFRNTWMGKILPVTGGLITVDNAIYLYTGVEAEYNLGILQFKPSFTSGLYQKGSGKDLGFPLEFKSEIEVSLNLTDSTLLGMSYNHISNASLGTKNPGANNYYFNLLKKF